MPRIFIARGVVFALALVALAFWQSAQAPFAAILAPKPEPDPSILFVGDIMLDRSVARHAMAASTSVLFAGVLDLFKTADARVANLEGAITTNPSVAQVDNTILHFTFDPALAQAALAPLNLSVVSLANNHTYDFGSEGYMATKKYLKEWGISSFGNPHNKPDADRYLSTFHDIRGTIFCFVGYHSLYNTSTATIVHEIESLSTTYIGPTCDKVIVFAHWGDEYEPVANAQQVVAAHEFVDAGADLVVGAHPHVVQNVETYKGKAIFYSLGNFMFDQNFSWATTHGLAVRATFGATSTAFSLTPITIQGQEARVAGGADASRVLGAAGRLAEFTLP